MKTLTQNRHGASGQFRSSHNDTPVISNDTYQSYLQAVKVSKANNQALLQSLMNEMPGDAIAAIVEYDGKQEEMCIADVLKFYIVCNLTIVCWLNGNEEPHEPYNAYPFLWMVTDWGDELDGAMYADEYHNYLDAIPAWAWTY